ncbi:MAG: hypothetical protein ACE14M_01145 [Terriglobales bacterium]
MRPVDRIGIAGVMLTALGAAFLMTAQSTMPLWAKWLVGPLCWYLGFALMLVWALFRAFGPKIRAEEEEEAPAVRRQRSRLLASNFLEHDYTNVA